MDRKMKKGIYILMGCLLLASCSKNSVETSGVEPIGFGVYAGRAVTKANAGYIDGSATNNNIPTNGKIGVFGYFHAGDYTTTPATAGTWSNTAVPNLMNNVPVTASAADGKTFTYSPDRYWPITAEDRISFIGYYPYADLSGSNTNTTGITPNVTAGFGSYNFSVNPDKTKQVDFMLSDLAMDQSQKAGVCTGNVTTGTVQLVFHHMLSNVTINVLATPPDNGTITVTSVKVEHVKNEGVCTPSFTGTPASNGATTTTFTWSSLVWNADIDLGTANTAENSDVLLMIPQSFEFNDAAVVTVFYDYSVPNNLGTSVNYPGNKKSMQLNKCTTSGGEIINKWEMNKKYVYTINLTPDKILFTGAVSAWTYLSQDIITTN
jgi:hypothetical protein